MASSSMDSLPLDESSATPTQESFERPAQQFPRNWTHLAPSQLPPPSFYSPTLQAHNVQLSGNDLRAEAAYRSQRPRSPPLLPRTKTSFDLRRLLLPVDAGPSWSMTGATPARTGVSPSSSPRLPSPPPFTEVQIGPKSPTIGDSTQDLQLGDATKIDVGATRRIRPGTKAADMNSGPPLVPLSELDSPFQLQEHLKALYFVYTRSNSTTNPITRETALMLATPPATADHTVDRQLWLYELCRFLTMKANNLIVAFFAESPPCSRDTCPEMRASEWQYLCAVHDPPKSCCAIDYCCHTLDWAANILTSPKYFSSRLIMGGEQGTSGVGTSMRHLTNIFRRVYRIFAHAWFQHRGVFWQVESNEGLYIFFKTVCDVYQLVPEDNYTIPVEAEGVGIDEQTPVSTTSPGFHGPRILTKGDGSGAVAGEQQEAEATTTVSVGATTRRHNHTSSTGSHFTTIAEGSEEDDATANSKTHDPEDETAEVELEALAANEPERLTLTHGLAKLDLSAARMGDVVAPEDPTPTPHDQDPLAFAGMEKHAEAVAEGEEDVVVEEEDAAGETTVLGVNEEAAELEKDDKTGQHHGGESKAGKDEAAAAAATSTSSTGDHAEA